MRHRHTFWINALLAISLASLPAAVLANNGNGHKPDKAKHNQGNNHGNNKQDKDIDWGDFRLKAKHMGYTGYKPLPPGIAKKLVRGQPLPPGIAKKAIPGDLGRLLPYYPGREWRIVGNDLVSVVISTAIVAEIIHDAFD